MTKRKVESTPTRRKTLSKKVRKIVYIFCNGKQTEKNYFEGLKAKLRLSSVAIEVYASNSCRKGLVEETIKIMKEKNIKSKEGETEVWVVFDVDALPRGKGSATPKQVNKQVDAAQELCKKNKIHCAISNECFEFWFLLHFDYYKSHLHRAIIAKKLGKKLRKEFEKTYTKDMDIFTLIWEKNDFAKTNATKLLKGYEFSPHKTSQHKPHRVSQCTPYTNVHMLVQSLEKMKEEEEEKTGLLRNKQG